MSAAYLRAKATMRVVRGGGEDDSVTTREENSALSKALAAPDEPDNATAGCIGVLPVLASEPWRPFTARPRGNHGGHRVRPAGAGRAGAGRLAPVRPS
ncbi:hypothetical protein ABZY57_12825 [Streptomyces sp. NPDC006450]|uniref:hypothetical protein n=1 Tax=Streptomyces sp. NPDC006450 TaxID=3155458 RepID=UPI00339F424D